MKKTKQLREMTRAEVEQKLKEEGQAGFNLKLRRSTQQLPNPLQLRHGRRNIARLKTVLNEDSRGIRKLATGAGTKE
jgi:large subunit ribosomal protein L29